jgi:hypothetical protein
MQDQTWMWTSTRHGIRVSVVMLGVIGLVACGGGSSDSGASSGIQVDQVQPNPAVVDVLTSFSIDGARLDQVKDVTLSACPSVSNKNITAKRITFSCTPKTVGEQQLQLIGANGQSLYNGSVQFERQAVITSVSPDRVKLNRPTTFTLTGTSLDLATDLTVTLSHCSNQTALTGTTTMQTFSCTPNTLGEQQLVIKNKAGRVVYQRIITVDTLATVQSFSPLETNVKLETSFSIAGQNFRYPMAINFPKCSNININDQSATQVRFSCVPSDVGDFPVQLVDPSGDVVAERVVHVGPFLTLPTLLFASGIQTCGTADANGLACNAASLGALYGLGQDGELKRGNQVTYILKSYAVATDPTKEVPSDDKCIVDEQTGLIWEQKTDNGGLRDKDWVYTWRNTNGLGNGGGTSPIQPIAEGSLGTTDTCAGLDDKACNTSTYISQLNAAAYCGFNDWRLPTLNELEHLVDYGASRAANSTAQSADAVVPSLFKARNLKTHYWSQSVNATQIEQAWGVDFDTGRSQSKAKTTAYPIRAVR